MSPLLILTVFLTALIQTWAGISTVKVTTVSFNEKTVVDNPYELLELHGVSECGLICSGSSDQKCEAFKYSSSSGEGLPANLRFIICLDKHANSI